VSPDHRAALLLTAQALTAGTAVPVPRESLLDLLAGSGKAPAPTAEDPCLLSVARLGNE
jgi:hypothetical protein